MTLRKSSLCRNKTGYIHSIRIKTRVVTKMSIAINHKSFSSKKKLKDKNCKISSKKRTYILKCDICDLQRQNNNKID